jgi:hypothetical protein
MRWLHLLWLALLSGCSSLDTHWHASLPNYRPNMIMITEVDDILKACGTARGIPAACVHRHPTFAHVFIKPGLSRAEYECFISHEILAHVIRGLDHDDRPNFSQDCGPVLVRR